MNRPLTFLIFYSIIGISDLFSLSLYPDFRYLTKPLIMILLIIYFVSEVKVSKEFLFFAGLVMAWLGDIFLMGEGKWYFILGLSSFLVMQIIYTVCFMRHPRSLSVKNLLPAGVVVLAAMFLINILWEHLGGMLIPVLIYTLSIVLMASFGLLRKRSLPGYNFIAFGVLLFVLSDSVLAYGKFIKGTLLTSLIVMITYIAAQYLIVNGYMRYLKSSE